MKEPSFWLYLKLWTPYISIYEVRSMSFTPVKVLVPFFERRLGGARAKTVWETLHERCLAMLHVNLCNQQVDVLSIAYIRKEELVRVMDPVGSFNKRSGWRLE